MTGQGSWNKPGSSKSLEKSHFRPHDFMSMACMAGQRIVKEIFMMA